MTDQPETRPCGRTKDHPAHRFMLGREVLQCPGSTSQVKEVATVPAAPAQPAERCGDMTESITGTGWYECVLRPGHHGSHADHSNMRWTEIPLPKPPGRPAVAFSPPVSDGPVEPDNPAARRCALAFNAVGPAVNAAGYWLPLSARRAVAAAVLATLTDPDAGYCPDCGRGDAGPTAEQYEQQRQRADTAASRLAALKRAHVALAEQAGREQAALGRIRAVLDRLDEFADLTVSVPDRTLYRGIATDLRAALAPQEGPK
ncbi:MULTISPECIES: hypothetical protein [unclassified Streptomyces]|uniref:hypothetical protein n=1 Tax=unclassified Streptomyces TaxID=2593676 RepID=UPI00331D17D3